MATRTIVTSQPDVECDVCARRLLRGEQPDVFVSAGRRRLVCELCAPRAAHAGWLRETDTQSLALPPARPRRGRNLFERLPAPFRVPGSLRARPQTAPEAQANGAHPQAPAEHHTAPYDALSDGLPAPVPADPLAEAPFEPQLQPEATPLNGATPDPSAAGVLEGTPVAAETTWETHAAAAQVSPYGREALEVFNASEFPRRVAGVMRSLGHPLVTVRSAEHLASVVRIVVAWELCWYRYEVDLSEPVAEAQVIAQGTELAELPREDRLSNAAAADTGALVLAGA
jgi:hypothetical protein